MEWLGQYVYIELKSHIAKKEIGRLARLDINYTIKYYDSHFRIVPHEMQKNSLCKSCTESKATM